MVIFWLFRGFHWKPFHSMYHRIHSSDWVREKGDAHASFTLFVPSPASVFDLSTATSRVVCSANYLIFSIGAIAIVACPAATHTPNYHRLHFH